MPAFLDPQLAAALAARRPVSLRLSLTAWAVQGAAAIVTMVILSFVQPLAKWVFLVAGVPFALVTTARRLEVDGEGLTLVPVLPFLPRQRLAFAELGPLAGVAGLQVQGVGYSFLTAELRGGREYRRSWLYRSRTVKVPALYGASTWGAALPAAQLAELVEAYRSPEVAGRWATDDAASRFASLPGTSGDA